MTFQLGNDTVTRVRAPLVRSSRDNSEYRDWVNPLSAVLTGCMVEPFRPNMAMRGAMEANAGREFEQVPLRLYAPADADIIYTDRIVWLGKTYEVITEPAAWTDFDGVVTHIVAVIRLRVG